MEKKFPQKWSNPISFLLQEIQVKAPYADASLACNGNVYPVHRMILSSSSEFFKDIFKQTTSEAPFIILTEIENRNLEYLLDYMYKGEVNVNECDIAPLLYTAEYLKIKGLTIAMRNRESGVFETLNSSGFYRSRTNDEAYGPLRKKTKYETSSIPLSANRENIENSPQLQVNQGLNSYNYNSNNYVYSEGGYLNTGLHYSSAGTTSYDNPFLHAKAEVTHTQNLGGVTHGPYDAAASSFYTSSSHLQHSASQEPLQKNGARAEEGSTVQNFYAKEEAPNEFSDISNQISNVQNTSVALDFKENTAKAPKVPQYFLAEEMIETGSSDGYSSDEDPVMTTKIRKIVRKTYNKFVKKMKKKTVLKPNPSSLSLNRNLITVSTMNKAEGRKNGNRISFCYFCHSPQTQIWRHMKNVHKTEPQVEKICKITEENELKNEIDQLRNLGNFEHNKEVLRAGNGELIVYRRPDNHTLLSYKDYSPCPKCLLFLSRNDLWRHCKSKCAILALTADGRGTTGSFRHLLFMSTAVLGLQSNFKKNKERILGQINESDELLSMASKDEIILHLGSFLSDNQKGNKCDIALQSMSLVTRLLLYVRQRINQPHLELFQILRPTFSEYIFEAIGVLSNQLPILETNSNLAQLEPSKVALQMRILLRKCLAVKLGISLRTHSEDDKTAVKEFEARMDKVAAETETCVAQDETLSHFLEVEMELEAENDNYDFTWDENYFEARDGGSDTAEDGQTLPSSARSAAAFKRNPYTPAENAAIFKYFREQIENEKMIRKDVIEKLFVSPYYEGELNNRSWKNIKYKVHNIIQKNKQKPA